MKTTKYEVTFYESGRYSSNIKVNTKSEAIKEAREFVDEISPAMKRIAAKKSGNLSKDLSVSFSHPASGHEASVYIHKIKYSNYDGWVRV